MKKDIYINFLTTLTTMTPKIKNAFMAKTAKQQKNVCVINLENDTQEYVVEKTEGMVIFDSCSYIGKELTDQSRTQEFVDFYISTKERLIKEELKREQMEREAEEKRILNLKELIKECQGPSDISENFLIPMVETASHWSDLYEGRSSFAFKITSPNDFEIIEYVREIHNLEGSYGIATHRAGEHHHTFNPMFINQFRDFAKEIECNTLSSDDYFFKSKETEKDFFMEEIKNSDTIEEVSDLIAKFNNLEDGYYDCNGTLIVSSDDLDNNFTCFSEDVYTYSFVFNIHGDQKYLFNNVQEEINEE